MAGEHSGKAVIHFPAVEFVLLRKMDRRSLQLIGSAFFQPFGILISIIYSDRIRPHNLPGIGEVFVDGIAEENTFHVCVHQRIRSKGFQFPADRSPCFVKIIARSPVNIGFSFLQEMVSVIFYSENSPYSSGCLHSES